MGKTDARPLDGVIAQTQACNGVAPLGPFRTASWQAQHPGVVTVRADAPQRFTSVGGSAENSLRTDPFGGPDACRTVGAARDPGTATYESSPAPAGGRADLPVREPPNGGLIGPYAPAPLDLSVTAAPRQRALRANRLRLSVGCPRENCTVGTSGSVKPRRGTRRQALAKRERALAAGERMTLELRLSRKQRRALRRALTRGATPRASLAVTATDDAGNRATRRRSVRIIG